MKKKIKKSWYEYPLSQEEIEVLKASSEGVTVLALYRSSRMLRRVALYSTYGMALILLAAIVALCEHFLSQDGGYLWLCSLLFVADGVLVCFGFLGNPEKIVKSEEVVIAIRGLIGQNENNMQLVAVLKAMIGESQS